MAALKPEHCRLVTVDTTVQEKAIAFPTDAKLVYGSIVRLAALARRHGVKLRQSYVRVARRALIMYGRYAHAKQFKRRIARLRFLNKRLGRVIRDIRRKTKGDAALEEAFAMPLQQAEAVIRQQARKRGQIKRELKRRSAIEAVIGHMKTDGRLDRNFLKGREGDCINAVLAAVGHNFRLLINWFRLLLRFILTVMFQRVRAATA